MLMQESYAQAKDLQPGFELWTGNGVAGFPGGWVRISRIKDQTKDRPVIICNDIGYRVGYLDAVRYRRPWWSAARSQGWGS